MAQFVIVIPEPDKELAGVIEEKYKPSYQYNGTVFLVAGDYLAGKIAEDLKFVGSESEPRGGVVLKLNEYFAGRASSDLWEWLDEFK